MLNKYSPVALNLVVKRHHLSEEKRELFGVRWASEDPQLEAEMTAQMNEITSQIEEIDRKLMNFGIDSKNRPAIVKALKKEYPDAWFLGFSESN